MLTALRTLLGCGAGGGCCRATSAQFGPRGRPAATPFLVAVLVALHKSRGGGRAVGGGAVGGTALKGNVDA